jgi:hypothetical protein
MGRQMRSVRQFFLSACATFVCCYCCAGQIQGTGPIASKAGVHQDYDKFKEKTFLTGESWGQACYLFAILKVGHD